MQKLQNLRHSTTRITAQKKSPTYYANHSLHSSKRRKNSTRICCETTSFLAVCQTFKSALKSKTIKKLQRRRLLRTIAIYIGKYLYARLDVVSKQEAILKKQNRQWQKQNK